jgi:hypothetical protein
VRKETKPVSEIQNCAGYKIMDKVQNSSNTNCKIPWLEPFRTDSHLKFLTIIEGKVKLSSPWSLNKHHTTKKCEGVEV